MARRSSLIGLFLSMIAPVLGHAPSVKTHNYHGKEPSDMSSCGVSLYIATSPTSPKGMTNCWITTSNQTNGAGEQTFLNSTTCSDYGTIHTLVDEKSGVDFSKSAIGPFSIRETGNHCDVHGKGCTPLLEYNGTYVSMEDNTNCTMSNYKSNHYDGFFWRCQAPCFNPTQTGPACEAPAKGPVFTKDGPPQQVSDLSICSNATSCSISAAKATAVAKALTVSKDVTTTNQFGVSVTFTTGMNIFGETDTLAVGTTYSWSKAIADSVGITNTTTVTTTTSYTYTQAPHTSGYLTWTPILECQNLTMNCSGTTFVLQSCTQSLLSDGSTPKGTYALQSASVNSNMTSNSTNSANSANSSAFTSSSSSNSTNNSTTIMARAFRA